MSLLPVIDLRMLLPLSARLWALFLALSSMLEAPLLEGAAAAEDALSEEVDLLDEESAEVEDELPLDVEPVDVEDVVSDLVDDEPLDDEVSDLVVVCSCVVEDEVSELDFFDEEEPHAPNVSASAAETRIAAVFFMVCSNQLGVIRL